MRGTGATGGPAGSAPTLEAMRAATEISTPARAPVRWFSRRAVLLHVALVVWFPGCFVAMWWQITVALAGNALGWLYAIEWPVFAVFGVIGWWQLVHDDEQTVRARRWAIRTVPPGRTLPVVGTPSPAEPATEPRMPVGTALGQHETESEPVSQAQPFEPAAIRAIHHAEEDDEELAAYNAYLARLATGGERKTWRNPTGADR
jgi:hypothetical protein